MLEADGVEVTRRGKSINSVFPAKEKPTRCNTLKGDYTEQAIRERIAGIRSTSAAPRTKSNIKMLIDIDARQSGPARVQVMNGGQKGL